MQKTKRKRPGGITLRAVLIAILLSVVNDYWIVQLEVVRYSFPTYAVPFYNCIFTLLVLTAVNSLVWRRFPAIALTRVEIITIYIMISISSAVCSVNMLQPLVSVMGHAAFFQTPDNEWGKLFANRLPSWLTVSDRTSLEGFYYGNSTLYTPKNFVPWIVPVLSWSIFGAVMLFTTLCLNSIFRKQWVDAERLTFPVVVLPLEMTSESGTFYRNRYMWMGFALSGVLTLLAGLSHLYPSVPHLRIIRRDIGQFVVDPPWNAMGGISMGFYFWAIGLAFLMPLELSFSCWFFFWLTKLELVMCRTTGLHELSVAGGGFENTYPFIYSQGYGAYLGFFVISMWASRKYVLRVLRTALFKTGELNDSREAIRYRTAVFGAAAGSIFLMIFAFLMGMTPWVILIYFALYLLFAVLVSRIRAELGFPVHDLDRMFPQEMLITAVGTSGLSTRTLTGFSLFSWFNGSYASHPSPHQMEAFKFSDRMNTSARQMFIAVLIAGTLAVPLGFWMLLHNYYRLGGATANMEMWALGFGRYCWTTLEGWLKDPTPPNTTSMSFIGIGFIVSVFLGWMRMRFMWFPLHPLAYALAGSWGVAQLWMPLLIGSFAKLITLRLGGLKAYRTTLPFFLGLILGEVIIGSLWTILGIVLNIPTYDFWPGKYY